MDPLKTLDELHAELGRVREIIADSERVLGDAGCSPHDLRSHILGLRYAIVTFTDLEDDLLPGVLRELSIWGSNEMERMSAEHNRRRALVAEALTALESLSREPDVNAAALRSILRALALSMADVLQREEDELITGALAREESLVWDGCDG